MLVTVTFSFAEYTSELTWRQSNMSYC